MASINLPFAQQPLLSFWPFWGTTSTGAFTLSSTSHSLSFVFQVEETLTISRIAVRQHSRNGTPPTYRISLMGVAPDGNEDGVIKNSGACYVDYTPTPSNDGALIWFNLPSAYNATRGEWLSIFIKHQTGTINSGNSLVINTTMFTTSMYNTYHIRFDGSVRSRISSYPVFAYGNTSKVFGMPYHSSVSSSLAPPLERGLRFKVPGVFGTNFDLDGAAIVMAMPSGGTGEVNLYTDDDTLLVTTPVTADLSSLISNSGTVRILFPTTVTNLQTEAWYKLTFKPISGNFTFMSFTTATLDDMQVFGNVDNAQHIQRSGMSSWTSSNLIRPAINPLFKRLNLHDPPSSSGGGSLPKLIIG